jgi:Fur family peroxide stress response transcriptional regulator
MNYNHLQNILSEHELKTTHQRLVILEALMENPDHPKAEDIHAGLKKKNPTLSLGTIYRVLELFVNKGIAKKVSTDQKSQRYDANLRPHNHIFVTNTNEIIDYEDEALNKLIMDYFSQKHIQNFNIEQIELQLNGSKHDPDQDVSIQ